MYGNPNMNERADMIGRALAKETDGDFTKFVHKNAKPRDMAQKWRTFKNIARMTKNPCGYFFWKTANLGAQNRVRLTWILLVYHLYQSFWLWLLCKKKKDNMIAHWLWKSGELNKFHGAPNELRKPVDRKKNYVRYSNFHQGLRNKKTHQIHTNWWCRDQNFRKYFEMRKRHDIKPSLSGFYHEPLFEKTKAQNQAWADLRSSRQAR